MNSRHCPECKERSGVIPVSLCLKIAFHCLSNVYNTKNVSIAWNVYNGSVDNVGGALGIENVHNIGNVHNVGAVHKT